MLEENVEVIDRRKQIQYLRVPCPTSGIDSIVETLKLLKDHGIDTRSIKSDFSQQDLFLVLEIESEVCLQIFFKKNILCNFVKLYKAELIKIFSVLDFLVVS